MSLSTTINYDNASNFTFDTDDIEISGSVAQLKLGFSAISDFSEDFADDTGFTYDNTKAEFTGGVIQQKDQTATNSLFGVTYSGSHNPIGSNGDLDWHKSGGNTSATLNGAPVITSGKLVCTGTQGLYYQRNSETIETHKFIYTPNYTGAPPVNVNIHSVWNGSNNNDRFNLQHSPSGVSLRVTLYDSSGSSVISIASVLAGWSPTAGQDYEFEIVIDSVAGTVRVFVDGVLLGTNSPGAWTRGTSSTRYYLGASPSVYDRAEGSFNKYIMFSNAQHTSGYTPGYTIIPNIYAETIATLPTFTYSGPGNVAPAGIPTSTETGTPRYIIQGRYWDGASWSTSNDTYAQASSKADIIANILTFPDTGSSTIIVDVVFGDSNTQSNVDQIDFSVQGELYPTDSPPIIVNSGVTTDEILTLAESVTETGADDISYVLNVAGTDKYWNGSAWADSSGAAQSNTAEEVTTNGSSLDLGTGQVVKVKAYLTSDDGTTTPSITSVTLSYDFAAPTFTAPSECTVYGYVRDILGDIHATAVELEVVNTSVFYYNDIVTILPSIKRSTANVDGEVEMSLVETATDNTSYIFKVRYTDINNVRKTVTLGSATVPNQTSANLAGFTFS